MMSPSAGPAQTAVPLEGERKPVTALFADLVGSTSLAESLDPEDWAEIVNRLYEVTSHAITAYGGTVTQFSGDGVVAIFGAPVAHEDDPERAVRAGLDLLTAVGRLSADMRTEVGADLEMRVGVNTGLAVVGSVGSEGHEEYTALGDVMNVAARMESAARPGTVLITETTHEHVADLVEAVDRGALEVKGKSEPIAAYEITSIRGWEKRSRGIPGLESPMVGRTTELDRLTGLLDVVRAGRGRMALVLGEPGIGKSRLLTELREHDGGVRWIEGRCLSYGRSLPHHLIIDLVTSTIGSDGQPTADQVERFTGELLGDGAEEVAGHLLHLLGLPTPPDVEEHLAELDPTAVRRRHVEALLELLGALAEETPIGLVCEDLHWADASSVDLLVDLASIVDRAPVLLLGTTRPERESEGWRFVGQARSQRGDALTELRLEALSQDDSRSLVANLLEIESLPGHVRDLILARTDGNPFFVEEVVRELIDEGLITRRSDRWVASGDLSGVDVPDSIQGLLLGRIDRLPDDARRSLRVASVLGRTFTADLLEAVIDGPVDIQGDLGTLEAHGLVRIATTRPEITYTFRHALVQESAYSGLLRRERQALHGRVAELLEAEHPDHPEEIAALLAHHLDLAGDADRAAPYLVEAGRQALARYANREAYALFGRAAELLAGRTDAEARRARVEATVGQAEAGATFIPSGEILPLVEGVLADAEAIGDERLLARVHLAIATNYHYLGELGAPQLESSMARAMELGERLEDDTFVALPLVVRGDIASGLGSYREAIEHYERAAGILERREHFAQAALNIGGAAVARAHLGDFAGADRWIERGQELAERSGDPNAILDFDLFRGVIETERGDLEEALAHTRRGLDQAREIGNNECAVVGSFNLGDQYLRMGDADAAIAALEESNDLAVFCNLGSMVALSAAWLAAARSRSGGDLAEQLADIERSLGRARAAGLAPGEADILLHRATVLAAQPDPDWDAVDADFAAAVSILERIEARPALARALRDHGAALDLAGRTDEAREKLERAAGLAEEMGLTPTT